MANPNKHDTQLADSSNNGMIGSQQSLVSDPAGLTSATGGITITYTTDDPGITPDGSLTIADGDGTLVTAEVIEAIEELNDQISKLNADLAAVRTGLISALDVLEAHGLMADS